MIPGQEPHDLWTPLDRKLHDRAGNVLRLAPSWVPASEMRRLNAYVFRQALADNRAYLFLGGDPGSNRPHREYGDPALYIDRMVSAIRGDTRTITVDGADLNPLAGPDLPSPPEAPQPSGDAVVDAVYAEIHTDRMAAWKAEAEEALATWRSDLDALPSLRARQAALRNWATTVLLDLTLLEAETDAVTLADSVVVLWPRPGDWPTVQVYDPGFYFPVIPANGDQVDFPDAVHIAWEFEDTKADGTVERFVRRLTWRMEDLTALRSTVVDGVPVWTGPDGVPLADGERLVLAPTDKVNTDGFVFRTLPWHQAPTPAADSREADPGDPPTYVTCVFTDATWPLDKVQAGDPGALDLGAATITTLDYDLGIDFLPVIHRPNTASGKEHYGRALCDLAVRLFDDLAMIDTLTAQGSQFLGLPAVWANGVDVGTDTQVIPGHIHGLGPAGTMHTLDLSGGIEQLMKLNGNLLDRLGVNLGIGELTGRASDAATSGIHKLLELAPAISVVGNLRAVREPKDTILLRMAQRMAQVAGALEAGPTPTCRIRYGSFIPIDQTQILSAVGTALADHALSTQTAVHMLVAAGFPIDDAQAEVQRIQAEDTGSLSELATALEAAPGVNEVIADKAGVVLPETTAPAPPVVELP